MYISQSALDSAVLFKFFEYSQSSDGNLNAKDLIDLFREKLGVKRVAISFENLELKKWIESAYNGKHSISSSGYKYVEDQLADVNSVIYNYARAGDDYLVTQNIFLGGLPASDRLVLRSDNQSKIDEIITDLDELKEGLSTNNSAVVELGQLGDPINSEIDAAKALVSGQGFKLNKLMTLLIPSLRYLSDKFGSSSIGEIAKRLMDLILDLV